jgi:tripartite-type tricarboxylate transporter receptor subunit TctC
MPAPRRQALLAAAGMVAAPAAARGAWLPSRPVHWVVPAPPGAVIDVIARLLAQEMGRQLGQTVVVENRVGAAGVLAAEHVARAAPDGHTLFAGNLVTFAIAPLLFRGLRWDARRDFVALNGIGAAPAVLLVQARQPWRSAAEFVAAHRDPALPLTYAGMTASGQHLTGALFGKATGLPMTLVPFGNGPQALTEVATGRVDLVFEYLLAAKSLLDSGQLRALGVAGPERLAALPEVPTLAEQGIPGAELLAWTALHVPAATPPPVRATLARALRAALRGTEARALFDRTATMMWDGMDAGAMAAVLEADIPRMRDLVERAALEAG